MTLRLGSGGALVPGRRLAAGGQGEVYAVESPAGHVFKRYFPRELAKDPALEHRLLCMVAAPPAGRRESSGHVTMAWPVDVVYDGGRFAGFIMPVIDMASTAGIHQSKGVLVGAYIWSNEQGDAFAAKTPAARLADALDDGERLHSGYRQHLTKGVSVAWKNIPYSGAAWAEWSEDNGCLGCFSSGSRGCRIQGSTSSIVLVLVIDSLDRLVSTIPTDASV